MNHNFRFYIMFLLSLLLLNGCSPSVGGAANVVLPTAASSLIVPTTVPTIDVVPSVAEAVDAETAVSTAITVPTVPVATAVTVLNTNVQYVIALTDVNVRSGPGTGYDIISWIADGQTAKVTGVSSDNSWWRVICPDDTIGSCWATANSEHTQATTPPTAITVPVATAVTVLNTNVQYVIALTDVNVRSGPGTGYDSISWIADGQTAKVTGVNSDNSWWRVICPDDTIGSCWVTAESAFTLPTTP